MKEVYAKFIKNMLDRLDRVAWENHNIEYFKLIKNQSQMLKDIDIVYKHMGRGEIDKVYKKAAKELIKPVFKFKIN